MEIGFKGMYIVHNISVKYLINAILNIQSVSLFLPLFSIKVHVIRKKYFKEHD